MKFDRSRTPAAPPWLDGVNAAAPQPEPVEQSDATSEVTGARSPEDADHTQVFPAASDRDDSMPTPPFEQGDPGASPGPPAWEQGPPGPPAWEQGPPGPPAWEQGPPPPAQWGQAPQGPPVWDQGPPPPQQWDQGPPPRWDNQAPPQAPQWDNRRPAGPHHMQPGTPPPQWDNRGPQAPPGQQQFAPPIGRPTDGPPQHFNQPPPGYGPPHTQGNLDSQALLRKARRAPQSGWRRTVHRISGGNLNPGDSRDTVYYDQLVHRLNAPVRGDFRVAVLSLKGGVGKTTTTIGLGSTFSHLRGDRVIAVDANPDLGTLAQRVPQQTSSTVRDVLMDDSIFRYSDIRAHTSQAPSRLEVLASERDPAVAETFGEQDYRSVMRVLQRFYNIILTDCGTGLSHSAMNGVLDMAQALILVSTPAMDGARSASATLDWLQAHGYGHLVSRAIVVLSGPRRGTTTINIEQLAQHFLARTRAVQIVPYDQHLAEGAEIDLELLNRDTRRAFVELAATVAEDFAITTRGQ